MFLSESCIVEWGPVVHDGIARTPLSEPDVPVCRHPARHLRICFKIVSIREYSGMELIVTGTTKYQCFPSAACHYLLPKGLSFRYVFEFANVMNLKGTLFCPTIFTLLPIETFDDL